MNDPLTLLMRNSAMTLDGISQYYVKVGDEQHKFSTLVDLFDQIEKTRGMIFCNTKKSAKELEKKLNAQELKIKCMVS